MSGDDQLRSGIGNGADKRDSTAIHQLWWIQFARNVTGYGRAVKYQSAGRGTVSKASVLSDTFNGARQKLLRGWAM